MPKVKFDIISFDREASVTKTFPDDLEDMVEVYGERVVYLAALKALKKSFIDSFRAKLGNSYSVSGFDRAKKSMRGWKPFPRNIKEK